MTTKIPSETPGISEYERGRAAAFEEAQAVILEYALKRKRMYEEGRINGSEQAERWYWVWYDLNCLAKHRIWGDWFKVNFKKYWPEHG